MILVITLALTNRKMQKGQQKQHCGNNLKQPEMPLQNHVVAYNQILTFKTHNSQIKTCVQNPYFLKFQLLQI
jgi:hypothetical protein